MQDITLIPTTELEQDLLNSQKYIAYCETALALGITTYSSGSAQMRLDDNRYFVKVITAELERRKTLGT